MPKRFATLFLHLLIFGSIFIFFSPIHSDGMDTDLYAVTGQQVPPNVLIILDNCASKSILTTYLVR